MFQLLIQKNICPAIWKFPALQYANQVCCVKWLDSILTSFTVSNGVKQGGVLSPILFNIYMDCLLCKLSKAGVGCHVGNVFTGAMAYADDLILLAPTRYAMTALIRVCEDFSKKYDINFNPSKSKMILYSTGNFEAQPFCMQGQNIEIVKTEETSG
jgi:hypothetical protein